jgi:hypothetical protein
MALMFNPIAGILQFVKTTAEVIRDMWNATGEPTGFKNGTAAAWTRTYDPTTRTVTLTPNGTQAIYVGGKKFTYSTAISAAHAVTTPSDYYFYIDNTGNLVASATPWDIENPSTAPAMFARYDTAMTPAGYALVETHQTTMDGATHKELHQAIGTYQDPTGAAGGFTSGTYIVYAVSSGTNPTLGTITPGLNALTLRDEDLPVPVTALADGGPYVRFERLWGTDKWAWTVGNDSPFRHTGNVPIYNPNTGSDSIVLMNNNQYICVYCLRQQASDDANSQPFRNIWILGQVAYTPTQNTDAARETARLQALAEDPRNSLDLKNLPPEWFIDAKMVVRYNTGFTNNAYRLRCEGYAKLTGSKAQILGTVGSSTLTALNDTAINITSGAVGGIDGGVENNQKLMNERLGAFGYIPGWVSGGPYRENNVVKYNSGIWSCITANTDATFTVANWLGISPMLTANAGSAASIKGDDGYDKILFVKSTRNWYTYSSSNGETADGIYRIATGDGGNSRWIMLEPTAGREIALTITAGDAIDLIGSGASGGFEKNYAVIGNAAGQNAMNVLPFGASAPSVPLEVTLIGRSNANSVTLATNDVAKGALVAGGFIELGLGTAVSFRYSPTLDRWVETRRNNY